MTLTVTDSFEKRPAPKASALHPAPERKPELAVPPELVAGDSPAMRNLFEQIRATVHSQLDVLLIGETGTGKELFARMIHASGPTAKGPFVAVNCAAVPNDVLEAQLFGVEGRIGTGADSRSGLFVKAEGGSIFLDEIGELPAPLQSKLLRVLQQREVLAVGARDALKVRLRVISASNKDLEGEVRAGRFRADLFYRLRGLQYHLPPLRDRREDIPALAARFVSQAALEHDKRVAGVEREALDLLLRYDWPGNVHELRSEIGRAVLLVDAGRPLAAEHLGGVRWRVVRRDQAQAADGAAAPATPDPRDSGSLDLGVARDALERRLITEALGRTGGVQTRAAKLLGITRNGLALKLKRLGIQHERA
jgi:transcriptional regulator with PAS, ATPase and Fis domain